MRTLTIINRKEDLRLSPQKGEVMTAQEYLSQDFGEEKIRVLNQCTPLRYQSFGYYVSLLAEARGHEVTPSLTQADPSTTRPAKTTWNMAILLDHEDPTPPSNTQALAHFVAAAKKHDIHCSFITEEDEAQLTEFDALFIRGTTHLNHFTYRFSQAAARAGMVVVDDPISIVRCNNKIFLHEALKKTQALAPHSFILQNPLAEAQLEGLPFPCILKMPDGCYSKGVVKADNPESLLKQAQAFFAKSDLLLVQAFVPTDFDWRIGVFNGRPLYASQYFMAPDHWQIYNWEHADSEQRAGQSACVPLEEVPPDIVTSALQAAALMGTGLYGVDLKQHEDTAYVIEVNDNPSLDAGIEDSLLGAELYEQLMENFRQRLQ